MKRTGGHLPPTPLITRDRRGNELRHAVNVSQFDKTPCLASNIEREKNTGGVPKVSRGRMVIGVKGAEARVLLAGVKVATPNRIL